MNPLAAGVGTEVPDHLPSWNDEEVCLYLESQSWSLPKLVDAVRRYGINGEAFLALNKADLVEFGIDSPVERNLVLLNIIQLAAATVRNEQPIAQNNYDDIVVGMGPPPVSFISSRNTPRKSKYRPESSRRREDRQCATETGTSSFQRRPDADQSPAKAARSPPYTSGSFALGSRGNPGIFTPSAPTRKFGSRRCGASPKAAVAAPAPGRRLSNQPIDVAGLSPLQRRIYWGFHFLDEIGEGWVSEAQVERLLRLLYPELGVIGVAELHRGVLQECDPRSLHLVTLSALLWSEVAQRKRAPEPDLESRQEQKDLLTRLFTEADSRFRRNYVDAFQLRPLVQAAFRTMTPLVQEDYYNAICGGQESISLQALLSNPYAMMELRPQPMDDTRKARLRRLDEAFDRVDGERTGVLSKTDFPEFARIVWPNIVPVEVGHYENCIFADCDPDNLGAISKSSLAGSQYAELLAGCGIGMAFPDGIERSEDGHGLKKSKLSRLASVDLTLGPSMALALSNPADAATVERHQTAVGHNAPQHLNTVQRERDRLEAIHHKQAQNILAGTATRTAPSKPSRTGLLENERRYASLVTLFERWDESSSQNTEGSNAIEFEELQTVLAEFFNWTPEEADKRAREVMKSLDTNHDGVLQFSEFTPFITGVTRDLEPQIFDELVAHLKQAIGNVSDDAEFERRDTLLEQLFNFWDYDGSEFIEEDEVNDVMTRYLDDPADDNTEEIARMVLHGGLKSPDSPSRSVDSYMFATPRLAMDAFKTLFHSIAKNHAPNDFDLMYYRLRRIVDVANKSARQRAVMNNRLVTVEMQQLVEDSSWSTPLIMYGTTTDPSTALEKMAEAAGQRLQVCMVTNSRSEKLCMKLIEKAFQKGAWFYVVLSPDPYDPVDILRELALRLQASEIAARKAFRLWIWAPFDGGRFHNFPALMLTYAKTLSLDKVKIPHDFRGKAPGPTVVPPLNV